MRFKVGDTLQLAPDTTDSFVITGIQGGTQYVFQQYTGGAAIGVPFALDITFVDTNPNWALAKTGISPWVWVGAAGGAIALVALIWAVKRKRG